MRSCFLMFLTFFAVTAFGASSGEVVAQDGEYDVVVYGGTSAGVMAAVQARRMGKTAVVVGPDIHLGGLTSGGLGWTDSGRKEVVGGLAREFYQRLKTYYDDPAHWNWTDRAKYSRYRAADDAMWVFEPRVAEAEYETYVGEHDIPVLRDEWLDRENGVEMRNGRIQSIRMLSGKTFRGKMFIDATYEGDLMAAAGVSFTVGREGNAKYDETLNGVQTKHATKHQFESPVSAYVVPGDPSSGLLPRVHAGSPGQEGEGDHRVQAYCFRMCLTKVPENRVPFVKPEGYDRMQYELLARYLATGWSAVFQKFDMLPNGKTDTNNHGGFSTDNIGMNYDYPEATYQRRQEIIAEHEQYQKGLMYFLANDPGVPDGIRNEMAKWGLAKDEFVDNGHWPHQIYVREARRMVSDFVMTERHLRGWDATPEPIGMGSYNMDSHNVQRYVDEQGHARNEGDIQVSPGGPYPVSYRAIVPREQECRNLLVPVCLSSSHMAYGSIRMEPVFMVLAQSAATAAAIAIDEGISVQAVDYGTLGPRLLKDGQVLEWSGPRRADAVDPAGLDGLVLDNDKAELTGTWGASSSIGGFVGANYLHDENDAKKLKSAKFHFQNVPAGKYEVRVWYPPSSNRATNALVVVRHSGSVTEQRLNQRKADLKNASRVVTIDVPEQGHAEVVISNTDADGYVIVDAVQLLPVP